MAETGQNKENINNSRGFNCATNAVIKSGRNMSKYGYLNDFCGFDYATNAVGLLLQLSK